MSTSLFLISPGVFSVLIVLALSATTLIPVIMISLLIRDKRKSKLW